MYLKLRRIQILYDSAWAFEGTLPLSGFINKCRNLALQSQDLLNYALFIPHSAACLVSQVGESSVISLSLLHTILIALAILNIVSYAALIKVVTQRFFPSVGRNLP